MFELAFYIILVLCFLSFFCKQSPMKDFGYDVEDFYKIDPLFGTNDDIEKLFRAAIERGIRIILDFVPNHSSNQHEWFKKSAKRDKKYENYYIWSDGKNGPDDKTNPPNNWVSTFYGPAWTYHEERKQWYYHNFGKKIQLFFDNNL